MTLQKLTYGQKTNPKPVIDRTKQATAEDFNEIKNVMNPAIDKINEIDDIIEGIGDSQAKKSFTNVAAATGYYNDVGTNPKPDDDLFINIEDVDATYKWASSQASKVLFVRNNVSETDVNNAQQSADSAQATATSASDKANGNSSKIGELGNLETDEDSELVGAINEVNQNALNAEILAIIF